MPPRPALLHDRTPTALCLAKTWALPLRTLSSNQTTGLVQLLSLATVCALPHSRHSNKVETTPKGLHQLAIDGSLQLRAISKSNGKPKRPGSSTRSRLASSSSLQRARCRCCLPRPLAGAPHPGRHPPHPPGSEQQCRHRGRQERRHGHEGRGCPLPVPTSPGSNVVENRPYAPPIQSLAAMPQDPAPAVLLNCCNLVT